MNRYRDWLEQAKRDLQRAHLDLEYAFWEWACFTSQQAAEKAVKALLMNRGFTAWGHSVTAMLRRLDDLSVPPEIVEQAQLLDTYYIPTRYPNGFSEGKPADYYNQKQAQEAIRAAANILRFCEDHLVGSG
ncbi:MAG: HEPN domain-containing protein [Chloroflexi bacterium]|nr:MAG: HEPN domain-containing protein [Chloroflexota bacterium]